MNRIDLLTGVSMATTGSWVRLPTRYTEYQYVVDGDLGSANVWLETRNGSADIAIPASGTLKTGTDLITSADSNEAASFKVIFPQRQEVRCELDANPNSGDVNVYLIAIR